MELFAYIVRYDIGFAPNPFFGACTLATCKPRIRKAASVGDWVVGFGSKQKAQEGRIVYALRVDETLTFDEYWADPRFVRKRPNRSGSLKQRYGDNVYHRRSTDDPWTQEDCRHSLEDGSPNRQHVAKDTNPPRVLISNWFAYYGSMAVEVPPQFRDFNGADICSFARDFRRNFDPDLKAAFAVWLNEIASDGLAGEPKDWTNLL